MNVVEAATPSRVSPLGLAMTPSGSLNSEVNDSSHAKGASATFRSPLTQYQPPGSLERPRSGFPS